MYRLIRSFLWRFDPEVSHHLALKSLQYCPSYCFRKAQSTPISALGLVFPNAIGLAAGFDVNGTYLKGLAKLGFGFIEIGCVTPLPQAGHVKPRLFRLKNEHALINRMGFYNQGVDAMVKTLSETSYQGILGINLGKNQKTPLLEAVNDYRICMQKLWLYADYFTINISSPNTADLRLLQAPDVFQAFMRDLKEAHEVEREKTGKHVPLVVKVSPDESDESLKRMAHVLVSLGIEGMIATNTTTDRKMLMHPIDDQMILGGLSGRPLRARALDCLRLLRSEVGHDLTLIGLGGIDSAQAAQERWSAGANLLQIYTGFIYEGPSLIPTLVSSVSSGCSGSGLCKD